MKSPQRNDMNRIEIRKTKHIYYEFERGEGGQQTEKKNQNKKLHSVKVPFQCYRSNRRI